MSHSVRPRNVDERDIALFCDLLTREIDMGNGEFRVVSDADLDRVEKQMAAIKALETTTRH